MLVRDPRESFDVRDIAGWIADAFAINRPGILVDQLFDVLRTVTGCESRTDSLLGEDVRQQRIGGTVKLRQRNDVVA